MNEIRKVLVVGSGAREHALAWRIAQDGVDVVCAPGNGGTQAFAKTVAMDVADVSAIVALAKSEDVDFVVIGPEQPLVLGAIDALEEAGIVAFGASMKTAQLEGSKAFSKEFMKKHGIPTAAFGVFDDVEKAKAYVLEKGAPIVVKADGLAAGKGVVVASTTDEAIDALKRMMVDKAFGDAGDKVVIEACIQGPEVSFHVVSDGNRYIALAPAQDHKRALEGDQGPNTGGMGAYSPPPVVTSEVEKKIIEKVVEPTLEGLKKEGTPFRGALFIGLMIVDGEPWVLEYNVRFGDPEAESIMMRWDGPILPMLVGSAKGDFGDVKASWKAPTSMCVVLASGGYPGVYKKGIAIEGLDDLETEENVRVFHAGTKLQNGTLVTSGGRVLAVTAIGNDLEQAAERVYNAVSKIEFEGMHFRKDIGWQAMSKSILNQS